MQMYFATVQANSQEFIAICISPKWKLYFRGKKKFQNISAVPI